MFKFDPKGFQSYLNSLTDPADTLVVFNNPGLIATQRPAKVFTAMVEYQGVFSVVPFVHPYFLLGVGFFYVSVPPLLTDPTTSLEQEGYNNATIAWTFGLGADVPISDTFGAFVQAKSVLGVLDDKHQIFPISLGVRYTFE